MTHATWEAGAAAVATRRPAAARQLRISVIGHTGSGKSTTARQLARALRRQGMSVDVIGLAEPLYRLQQQVYAAAAVPIAPSDQDQQLLETLASQLRRIQPASLAHAFLARLERSRADAVVNPDLRDPWVDYPALREAGFKVVRVRASESIRLRRLTARRDRSVVAHSETTRELDRIPVDATIVNDGSLGELAAAVDDLIGSL